MNLRTLFSVVLLSLISLFASAREVIPFNSDWAFKKGPFTTDPLQYHTLFTGNWQVVTVPHTWNAKDMQVPNERFTSNEKFYVGDAYYRKTFQADAAWKDKRIFIKFEGVNTNTEVYLNNKPLAFTVEKGTAKYATAQGNGTYNFVGRHQGGYAAFVLELTHLLQFDAQNEILVKVNNEASAQVIPVNHTLFPMYGGIYRPVELILTNKVNIAVNDYAAPGIYISQKKVNKHSADIAVKVKLENKNHEPQNITVRTSILEADGQVKMHFKTDYKLRPQGRQELIQDLQIKNPHLWQGLDDPYLYQVRTQVLEGDKLLDEVTQSLGLRKFELRTGEGFFLNDIKYPMYGVTRHQDRWGKGSALSNADHDEDLAIIKEMGATTIRLAHYQQSEYFYAQCDRIGFIVWAEIPFVNRVSTLEEANAKQQLTELIRQNYNHASIYIWGLHNEVYTPNTYTIELTTKLNDLAKTEDPYRYTVQVSGYNLIDHPVNNNADVQGINHYFGWYNGVVRDVEKWADQISKDFKDYNIIFSEYGAEADPKDQTEIVGDIGNQWANPAFFPEEFATKFHEIHWATIQKHPIFLASYLWNTFDFATPITALNVEPRNYKGLVTFDRKLKKDPFYWYKANWNKEPVLYLTQRRVIERSQARTDVSIYSNVGTPDLFVNGVKQEGRIKGETDVHYIFKNVQLQTGDNEILTQVKWKDKTLEDKISWHYLPNNPKAVTNEGPKENKSQHIGL